MAPTKIEAIILKRSDFRETSVILSLYTGQFGKIRCILKGVRKSKGRVPPLAFTPGSCIFAFFYMRRSELGLLSSPSLIEANEMKSKENLVVWHTVLNLVNLFTPEKEKEEKLFELLKGIGKMLPDSRSPEILYICFKLRLIKILGYGIQLNRCIICNNPEKTSLFSGKLGGIVCQECSKKDVYSVKISQRVLGIMRQFEKMDFERLGVIKQVPLEILLKINFYTNIILNYQTGFNNIWWENEKNILQ